MTISDTAGIRETRNPVEREGVRRGNLAVKKADILILVFDATAYPAIDEATLSLLQESSCVVFNKTDAVKESRTPAAIEGLTAHHISCITGEGIQELTTSLSRQVRAFTDRTEAPLLTRARHREALGISEETDAIVVLISEEKSKISVAEDGRFSHIGMDQIALQKYLNDRMFIASGD